MDLYSLWIISIIAIAFIFDFINGFHDAANSIATIVTTKVLSPNQAVVWAAFFNFIAFLFFNLSVAHTIGEGLIENSIITPIVIFAALISAIIWNLFTWYLQLPSSSSHALIGGLIGAGMMKGGINIVKISGVTKVSIGIFLAPLLGLLLGFVFTEIITNLLSKKNIQVNKKLFNTLQLISSAFLSITHGSNDAQKTMGIIALLLFSASWLKGEFYTPFWVIISCQLIISIGTLFGGWRIVKTMGKNLSALDNVRGCIAESSAAIIISLATKNGIPLSTSQTLTGSITGTGISQKNKPLKRNAVIKRIVLSWILTIPATIVLAAVVMYIASLGVFAHSQLITNN